jgi:outer membrane protein assembly factor BamB
VYVGSYDKNFYALARGGAVKWRFGAADKLHGPPAVAANGTILVGSQDDHLYALSPTGILLWYLDLGGDVDAAPYLSEAGILYTTSDAGELRAYR